MIAIGVAIILVGVIGIHISAFLDGQDFARKSKNHQMKKLIAWVLGGISLMLGIYIVAAN